jgi:hypothetical protein
VAAAPQRLVLVIIGALFNRMAPVLWVIAVLSNADSDPPHALHVDADAGCAACGG